MKKILLIPLPIVIILLAILVVKEPFKTSNGQWEAYYNSKKERKEKGIKGNKQMRIQEIETYFKGMRTKFGETESHYPADYLMTELKKLRSNKTNFKSTNEISWVHRGPGNVGGRTRAVVVDVSDPSHNTWFAGSATGGAWKTTDAGQSWENISQDIPYHAVPTIVQSTQFPDVLFIGTGESFPGSIGTTGGGVFKSVDKGENWVQLEATAANENFRYVNRLCLHPSDTNILLAATTTGIYRTSDGGSTWDEVYESLYSVEDIKADTSDFNTLYAGVNSFGIVRSNDGGLTWNAVNEGLFPSNGRFEIAISPTNPQKVYLSVENSDRGSDVYVSTNGGDTWNRIDNIDGDRVDYLGGQGGYDNIIAVHPYYEDSVFVAGVNTWKIGITNNLNSDNGSVTRFDTNNTYSFLEFIDFSGIYPGLSTGDVEEATNLETEDWVNVEVRFGSGLKQMAHRFTVPPRSTSGVPAIDYVYEDYVEVPFEVWDVTNNRQLMCSFRDQENDGEFNLYERSGEDYGQLGREYIFINSVAYDESGPDANIAQQSGRSYKLIYFMWPTLAEGGTWVPDNLPNSEIIIEYSYPEVMEGRVLNVSDAYGSFSNRNTYNQGTGYGKPSIPGFHPDHHALTMVPIDPVQKTFWVVNGNDGGLGLSKDNGNTFEQITNGYTTTQFYGVSKKPYRNEYIGGMQDNGTWQSPSFTEAGVDEDFIFRVGGDGFETIWRLDDTNQIMASVYNNDINVSLDHGETWTEATTGIDDGPFVTKLTMLPSNPKRVYAVGSQGLYYTNTFGLASWRTIDMPSGWLADGWSITSSHQIKYSIANDSILWAGASVSDDFGWKIFVSTDLGETFSAITTPEDKMDIFVSNIATHPTNPNVAYLLYSAYAEPKILRTSDLGETWEDISGFSGNVVSANGFPDVGTMSLMVFPDDTNRIWVGTELGIVESLDNGETWGLLESNLPTVPVYEMFMQDNQVVAGTYGRGIWSYQYGDVVYPPVDTTSPPPTDRVISSEASAMVSVYPNPTTDKLNIDMSEYTANEQVSVKLLNLNGAVLETFSVSGGEVFATNLREYGSGSYVLMFESTEGTFTKRIIVK